MADIVQKARKLIFMRKPFSITLLPEEQTLVQNADIFYLKASITQKIIQQLNRTKKEIQATEIYKNFSYPLETDLQLGKIARGENYQGLPYLMLDFPRLFKPHSIFAFRTFFWWGNYCLCILHLSGDALQGYKSKLLKGYKHLLNQDIYVSSGTDEWHHELNKQHYTPIDNFTEVAYQQLIDKQSFVKLVQRLPLNQLEKLPVFGKNAFELLLGVIDS